MGIFPDRMRAAHESLVRHSHKPEAEVLPTLEANIGRQSADTIRTLAQTGRIEACGEITDE